MCRNILCNSFTWRRMASMEIKIINKNVWNATKFMNILWVSHSKSSESSHSPKTIFLHLVLAARIQNTVPNTRQSNRNLYIFSGRKGNGFSIHESWTDSARRIHKNHFLFHFCQTQSSALARAARHAFHFFFIWCVAGPMGTITCEL